MKLNGLLALVGEDAPAGTILSAGTGLFAQCKITLTEGVCVGAERMLPSA